MTEPSAAEFYRFVQEAKEQRARADALTVALTSLVGPALDVYSGWAGEPSRLDYEIGRDRFLFCGQITDRGHADGCRWEALGDAIRAALAADQPVSAVAELLAAADNLVSWCEYNAQHWPTCAFSLSEELGCSCGRTTFITAYRRARAGLRAAEGPGREGEQR